MMTGTIRAGIAAAALLAAPFAAPIAAQAADMQSRYRPPIYSAPSVANWNGLYAGLNAGYGFGKSNWNDPVGGGSTGDFNVNGGLYGGTLGYNMQTGTWVWGVEGDFDMSTMKGSNTTVCGASGCETKNSWLATARARLGYGGWGNWLPYLTGGLAMGDIKGTTGGGSASKTNVGYAFGAGVEYALLRNWSAKVEYLYADLGKATCPAATCGGGGDLDFKFKTNIVRLGVNYRF